MEYLTFAGIFRRASTAAARSTSGTPEPTRPRSSTTAPPDGPEKGGEVIVTLHGEKISGRYALIQTGGKNWLAHRMKEQKQPTAADLAPMLATEGSVEKLKSAQWAFEGKWDGYRVLVDADHGR